MLKKYDKYLTENVDNTYEVECKIDKKYLLEISGQSNIIDALKNELNWTKTITVINVEEIKDDKYKVIITVNEKIIEDTDSHDIVEGIFYEFKWLDQSGIFIKKVI